MVKCPICRKTFLQGDPPQNLALKNLCDAFLLERTGTFLTGSSPLCSLHKENIKLFCLDHLEPVCVICLHSRTHRNHKFKPINEAAQQYKEEVRKLLTPLQEKRELLNNIKSDFDQAAEDIEVQAEDTERQIKDVFSTLRRFLQKEESVRIGTLREEKQRKSQMMKTKTDAVSKEIATLSGRIRAMEEAIAAEDISFLQSYSTLTVGVNDSDPIPDVEELTSEALLDMDKHLSKLSFTILDRMREKIFSTFKPEPSHYSPKYLQASGCYSVHPLKTRRPLSLALPQSQAQERSNYLANIPLTTNPLLLSSKHKSIRKYKSFIVE